MQPTSQKSPPQISPEQTCGQEDSRVRIFRSLAASEGLTPEQRQVMYDALTCISGHLERLAAPRKSQNGETDL